MEDYNIIRFIVSTDNHLGFMEKDPVRCNDSFASFEEVFQTAKHKGVDFILFAGDMFHENKPSRHTLHSTMQLLRTYCLGNNPVFIEVLNDQEEIFKTSFGRVNYEDPYQSISLPVFAIHGNHDDPSRDGTTGDALAALDLLAVSNMINYFGKADRVEDIEIAPILIRKGSTNIALYGLGAIRDERLNRMWNQKKVKFVRLTQEQGRDEFFNIFLLHQNRDYGRGRKNCVHESMIPDWMDLVIWGNEHECQPQLMESLVGTYRILQPGSSVACSLSRGESSSCPKHMAYFEIKDRKFRMKPVRYKSIRSFVYDEVNLRDYSDLNPNDPKIEDKIRDKLTIKVNNMIREARVQDESEQNDEQRHFKILNPEKVLVRLRVEYDGFPVINHQRFGSQFVNSVANPSELLLLAKKRKEQTKFEVDPSKVGDFKQIFADGVEEEINKIMIEDLVNNVLSSGKSTLSVLQENEMAKALDDFIFRKDTDAIKDVVTNSLHRIQIQLAANTDTIHSTVVEEIARARQALQSNATLRDDTAMDAEMDDEMMVKESSNKGRTKAASIVPCKENPATRKTAQPKQSTVSERKSSRRNKTGKSYFESDDSAGFENDHEEASLSDSNHFDHEISEEEEYVKPKKSSNSRASLKAPTKSTKVVPSSRTSRGKKATELLVDVQGEALNIKGKKPYDSDVINLADEDVEDSPPTVDITAREPALIIGSQPAGKAKQRQLPLSFTQGSSKPKSSKSKNLASGWDD